MKTIAEKLEEYFEKEQLGKDGGLNEQWAHLKVGPFKVPFPNTESRRKALVFHDIHHIVTGYDASWKGEASISAWEVSTGCGGYIAAWVLDLYGFAIGMLLYPVSVYKAFIRGRYTRNLYKYRYTSKEASSFYPEELAKELNLGQTVFNATIKDKMMFIVWGSAALSFSFVSFVLPWMILFFIIRSYS